MDVQAVIFDRDHTLIHVAPAQLSRARWRIAAAAPGLGFEAVQAAWRSWPGPWPRTPGEEPAFWAAFAAALFRDVASAADGAGLAAELAGLYHTSSAAYPDTPPTIAALRAVGMRLAVLSNFELPDLAPPLAHAGIDPGQFDALVSSAGLGWAKPDPRAYMAAAAALDLPPAACWFVDDLAENVAGARLVGMRAFRIDRTDLGDPAGDLLGSLLDLIALLPATAERCGSPSRTLPAYDSPP
jgi:putative hydrolase of the HAD superfamily